jgi:hypothetical protein
MTESCSYLWAIDCNKAVASKLHRMSYTPTHDKNGCKLSKAERRIANKAKYAAERAASKPAKAAKAKLNPRKVKAVAEAFDFAYMDAVSRTYEALPEPLPVAKPKRNKRKAKRVSSNDRLEAQAQRLSRGLAGTEAAITKEPSAMKSSTPSADMDIYELAGGDPVAAARHAVYMGIDSINMDDIL